jgi:hypothetical protein
MTSSSVSVQGLTYQITCVSLENCLTSGVHLRSSMGHASVDSRKCLCLQGNWKMGEGRMKSGDRVIGSSGDRNSKPTNP